MTISSRTPEGVPLHCSICGKTEAMETCYPGNDSVCPRCGSLLWLVRDRVNKVSGIPLEQIDFDYLLRDDLGADSLDLVEAIMEVEEQSGITIPDDIATQLRSVRDVIKYLRSQQGDAA